MAMQRAIDLQARNEGLALAIRVGVSAGDVTLEDGDCFGTPVVEASRLCAAADGGHDPRRRGRASAGAWSGWPRDDLDR